MKKLIWVVVAIASICVAIVLLIFIAGRPTSKNQSTEYPVQATGVSESANVEDPKSRGNDRAPSPTQTNPGGKLVVEVILTTLENTREGIKAQGVVLGVLENGGLCSLVASQPGTQIEVTSKSESSAQSTSCSNLNFTQGQLSSGTWSLVLTYESARYFGESSATKLIVTQ